MSTIAHTDHKIKRVGFFGDAEAKKSSHHYRAAFKTAKLLAEHGYIIVNGGGPGVMLASTLGAVAGGGQVETVIVNNRNSMTSFEGEDKRNTSLCEKKYTEENYERRTEKMIKIADAFVIFKGGTGTVSELGMVWGLAKLNYKHQEPVVFYANFWKKILAVMVRYLALDSKERRVYFVANSPIEVLDYLKRVKK